MTDPTSDHLADFHKAKAAFNKAPCDPDDAHVLFDRDFVRRLIADAEARGAAKAQRWIPVEEAVPEVGVSALVFWRSDAWGDTGHFGTAVGWRSDEDGRWHWDRGLLLDRVTHWQPLPAAPEPTP